MTKFQPTISNLISEIQLGVGYKCGPEKSFISSTFGSASSSWTSAMPSIRFLEIKHLPLSKPILLYPCIDSISAGLPTCGLSSTAQFILSAEGSKRGDPLGALVFLQSRFSPCKNYSASSLVASYAPSLMATQQAISSNNSEL
jgi:hypothetical protein